MLKNNWVLKGAAIIFAVLIWSYVMSETNPYYSVTIKDIPIRIENASTIEQNGYAIIGGIEGLDTTVDITVEVRRSDYQKVTEDNIMPVIDLSVISGTGTYQVPVSVTTQYGNVEAIIEPYVEVNIDEKISRTIPVTYELSGGDSDSYYYGEPTLDSDTIVISGARVDIEKAEQGIVTINLDDVTSDINKSMPVDVYDSEGNILDNVYIKDTFPSVVVNMEVLPKKSVYINAMDSISGTELLADGYEVKGVTVTPSQVEIAGPQDILDTIDEAYLETIYINRTDKDFTVSASVKEIDGVKIVKNGDVTVVVHIGKIES
ncbi:MAG: CdaR family protein [Eubacteriales bacterium]